MKKLMIVAVAALLGLSWWTTFSSAVQKPAEYQSYLAEAQKNEKKGIYYDAILNYQRLWNTIREKYGYLSEDRRGLQESGR